MSTEIALSFDYDKNLSGTSGRQFNRLKVPKNGSVVVRILPPFGTNHGGALYHKYTLHWGFKNADGEKRPVACSYPTERFCPVCEMVFQAKKDLEELKKQGVTSGARFESLKNTIEEHESKTSFLFNVVDFIDGQVKMLEIPKTAVSGKGREIAPNSLMGKITEAIQKRKFDPVSLNGGVWFEVSRNGEGFNTIYSVDFNRIINPDQSESLNRTILEQDTVDKIVAQMSGNEGPMYDIHAMYEPRTSLQLKSFLEGQPVPSKPKRNNTDNSSVTEEAGDTPRVSYSLAADSESQDDIDVPPPPKASAATKTQPTAPKTSAPSTAAPAPTSQTGGAQSEIQRLRERARQRAQTNG